MRKILSSVLLLIGALTASITAQNTTPNGGVLTSLEDASNTATYTLTAGRGSVVYSNGELISQADKNNSDPNYQFAFLSPEHDGNYYMYSLGAKKFVTYDEGEQIIFTNNPAKIYPVTFSPAKSKENWEGDKIPDNAEEYVYVSFSGTSKNLCFNSNKFVLFSWGGSDWGSVYLVEEVNSDCEDLTEALDILENTCNVTFELYDVDDSGQPTGSAIATETQLQHNNSSAIIPASFTTSDWYDYKALSDVGNDKEMTIKVVRTVKSTVIQDLNDLSNGKAYRLATPRGTFTTTNGRLANTIKNANYEVSNFAIIKSNDKYYLWSIKDKQFVGNEGDGILTSTPTEITFSDFKDLTDNSFGAHPNIKFAEIKIGGILLIAAAGGSYGVYVTPSSYDAGSACVVMEDGDFSFPVEIRETEWATFSSPLPITKPSDVTAYTATMESDDRLKLTQIEGNVIPANTGVLLNATEGSYNFSFPTSGAEEGDEDNVLKASVGETTVTPNETYVLANGNNGLGFYLLNDVTIPAFKAYIEKDDAQKAAAYLSFGNSVTGLVGVESSAAEADVYYDVQGRKVVAPQKGQLYIVNGKKVLY